MGRDEKLQEIEMRFMRKQETAQRVGFSESHVMHLVREGKFPQPVPLGETSTAVAFVEDEVLEWMQERVDNADCRIRRTPASVRLPRKQRRRPQESREAPPVNGVVKSSPPAYGMRLAEFKGVVQQGRTQCTRMISKS